jgi:hypothetical protein
MFRYRQALLDYKCPLVRGGERVFIGETQIERAKKPRCQGTNKDCMTVENGSWSTKRWATRAKHNGQVIIVGKQMSGMCSPGNKHLV